MFGCNKKGNSCSVISPLQVIIYVDSISETVQLERKQERFAIGDQNSKIGSANEHIVFPVLWYSSHTPSWLRKYEQRSSFAVELTYSYVYSVERLRDG